MVIPLHWVYEAVKFHNLLKERPEVVVFPFNVKYELCR